MPSQHILDIVTSQVALIGLIVTICFSLNTAYQTWSSRRRDAVKSTFGYLDEWRSVEFTAARAYIATVVKRKLTEAVAERGYRGLTEEDQLRVRRVSYFLDYLGMAMSVGYIDERLVLTEIGTPVEELWRVLGPAVLGERQIRTRESGGHPARNAHANAYQAGFEHIAALAHKFKHPTKHLKSYNHPLPMPPLSSEGIKPS